MPRLDSATAALFMTTAGAELLLGNTVDQIDAAARTDTAAAHGERHFYISGSTIVMQIFDQAAGAWRATALS